MRPVSTPVTRKIITHLSAADPVMRALIAAVGPYRLRADATAPPFQILARAIAHQQLNGTAANTILGRFIERCGAGGFPLPAVVLACEEPLLRACGFSFAKIASLKDLAHKTESGVVPAREALLELENEAIIERLTQVRGIGRWTVEMMLMFHLRRPDVLPVDDFGVRNGFRLAYGLRALPAPRVLARYGECWAPHRTAAAWYLWRAVELHKAGKLPPPPKGFRLPRVPRRHRKAVNTPSRRPRRAGPRRPRPSRSRSPR